MVYGFQRNIRGLIAPGAGGLSGFQRQGLDQRKKSTDIAPAFGPGSLGPQWSGGGGKFNIIVNGAVSGAVANAFMYLPKAIKPLTGAWYWEGAVSAFEDGREVGRGYLEMTGYGVPIRLG